MTAKYEVAGYPRFETPTRLTLKGDRALNVAYFCPLCGTVWARLHNGTRWWRSLTRLCDQHISELSEDTPGSLQLPWEEDPLVGFTQRMVEIEFMLLYDHLTHKESANVPD
jgi:hypothetical protein